MPETMPRSRGAASLALASALGDAWSEINTQLRAVLNQQRKRLNRSGFGRGLGGLLGALAINVALPGAGPFITGLAGGLGSRLGSEIGSKSAGKRKTVSKGDFFQETRKDLRSDISDANRQFTQGQNIGALFDAVSAGLSADTFKTAGAAVRGYKNPLETIRLLRGGVNPVSEGVGKVTRSTAVANSNWMLDQLASNFQAPAGRLSNELNTIASRSAERELQGYYAVNLLKRMIERVQDRHSQLEGAL